MKKLLAFAFVSALLLNASRAEAGMKYESAYCYRAADLSGYCYGTMRGFRMSTDPNASANFQITSNGGAGFQANWGGGKPMTCTAPAGSPVAALWPIAMSNEGYFQINWSAAGECNYLVIGNGSAYRDTW